MSLSAYRTALRATRTAFRQDTAVLMSARAQIKEGFEKNRNLDPVQAQEEITKLNKVSRFLVENIVQAEKQVEPVDDKERYLLHIHEKTELGDNETIKQKKTDMGSLAGAKVRKCTDK